MVKRTIDSRIMESIKKYIEKISQYYKIEAIILFGSYAKGTENEYSDIDIAIISSDFSDIIEDGAKLIGLTWKIDTRIEPHPITTEDYQEVSNPFENYSKIFFQKNLFFFKCYVIILVCLTKKLKEAIYGRGCYSSKIYRKRAYGRRLWTNAT